MSLRGALVLPCTIRRAGVPKQSPNNWGLLTALAYGASVMRIARNLPTRSFMWTIIIIRLLSNGWKNDK
jgi:hypothetical protein